MRDIIAGRPVFGEPNTAGGFRLRYGRPRTSGLAAAGVHPVSMHAMGDFLAVGTQMKIERPGKACAVVPCDELDGPTILLKNGRFGRIQSTEMWHRVEDELQSIWDNGELMIGYGEFAENNKPLVPSGYSSRLVCKICWKHSIPNRKWIASHKSWCQSPSIATWNTCDGTGW